MRSSLLWLFAVVVGCGKVSDPSAASGGAKDGRSIDPSIQPPTLRLPQNGRTTGSVWSERARRPRFKWDAQPDLTFEIEIDDSCEVGDLESCKFPSPEWTEDLSSNEAVPPDALPVSERSPVGRRYYWHVRSCTADACSAWSAVRYVDVGRQRNDFDGDGYGDVVLPDEGNTATPGRVLVGFGPTPSDRVIVFDDPVKPEVADHFGQFATPVGDVDADGFADLLVTSPGDQATLPGRAHLFFGSADFADAAGRTSLLLAGDAGDRLAGIAAAAGDVNADGRQDFVIDSFPSGPRLYQSLGRSVKATKIPVVRSEEWLEALSSGDVTGDGHSDILAVSVFSSAYLARYDVLPGTSTGFADPVTVAEGEDFPVELRCIGGDVNNDGFSDLSYTVNDLGSRASSHIEVSLGAETPVLNAEIIWASGLADTSDRQYVDLGASIAAGDVNGDGSDDSLVAFSWHDSGLVQANLYLGGKGYRPEPDAVYSFETGLVLFISTGVPNGVGDVNGDGFDDVFLTEDFAHSGKLYFGGAELDVTSDGELSVPAR